MRFSPCLLLILLVSSGRSADPKASDERLANPEYRRKIEAFLDASDAERSRFIAEAQESRRREVDMLRRFGKSPQSRATHNRNIAKIDEGIAHWRDTKNVIVPTFYVESARVGQMGRMSTRDLRANPCKVTIDGLPAAPPTSRDDVYEILIVARDKWGIPVFTLKKHDPKTIYADMERVRETRQAAAKKQPKSKPIAKEQKIKEKR